MKPQVYHVDAFTSQPFRGNSAGVVFPADNLSEAQMQLIARELGHSETAFLLHNDDSDVRIRYFTPTVEVPICGHATVAAHYVRAKVLGLGNCTIWQTSLAGKHRVTIEKHNDDYRISLEQGTPGFEPPLEGETREAIINALHLTEDDILPGLPIQVATTGHSKVMIPLKPEVDIDALSPDLAALSAISKQIGCNGFFPFQIRPGKNETDGRMFSPAIGIVEDPVTGNANGPMCAWLVHHNVLPHDGKVLLPFVAITGVGEGAAKQFAEEYARRPYETVEDIADRGKANKSAIDELRQHGVLDGLPETAQISLFG